VAAGQALRLAPRPVFLSGREDLLAGLEARLGGDGGAGPREVALCGLGGAGKTSLALEYAHRHLAEGGVCWQLPAEDPAVLAAGFGELAAQLGAAEGGDPVAAVHTVLAASSVPWLLVFDDAPDRATVARFLPPAGPGRVLITSRNQIWPPGQVLDVPVLDPQMAGGFLVSRTGDTDQRAALELAGKLGGLPLALEQAAAYIQASGGSLAGYLASFLQRRPDLLGRGEPTGYPETVATTWRLAFEDLQHAAPGAAWLLRLLAFCAPETIPLRLLLQPRPGLAEQFGQEVAPVLVPLLEDELAAGDAIAALRRYSLISPPADGSVSVHRLVQAVTADQMPAELASQWRQAAAALIEAAIPDDTALPGTWPGCAALLPHAQAVLDLISGGMFRIAQYLGYSGNYPAAQDLFAALLPVRERVLGPEHPGTLTARHELATWTGQAGDAAKARDQFAALVPVDERVLGSERPETLRARADLARWTGEAGDAGGARDQFAALVPVDERVFWSRRSGNAGQPRPSRRLDRAGGGSGGGPRPVRGTGPGGRAGPWPGPPSNAGRPRQPRLVDRAGGRPSRCPRPVRGAAPGGRAGPWLRTSAHADRPRQPRLLHGGCGGCGRGPRPVCGAAAGGRAGPWPRSRRHADRSRQPHLLD
jgi:hypothetical protein